MDIQIGIDRLINLIEKPQELPMPVPRLAFTDNSFENIQ
jgi:hypothetical protein